MAKYKLVIFDMDGTVLNTLDDIADAVNYTLEHFGYSTLSKEKICCYLGNGSRWIFEQMFGADNTEVIDKLLPFYLDYYKEHCAIHTKPYPGILDLMEKLHEIGIKVAIVSNKPDFGVQSLCQEHFPGIIDFACGERKGIRRKPAPDSVREVLSKLQFENSDAVYVGDSEVDIATAKNSGLDCIIVSWGFRNKEELIRSEAKLIVDSVEQLMMNI